MSAILKPGKPVLSIMVQHVTYVVLILRWPTAVWARAIFKFIIGNLWVKLERNIVLILWRIFYLFAQTAML